MKKYLFLLSILFFCSSQSFTVAQIKDIAIKVYDFDEGLSHRNVFKITQDDAGFIWVASINGLNRFDGYDFLQYNSSSTNQYIPNDVISDMIPVDDNTLLLGHPDFFTYLNIENTNHTEFLLKEGQHVRRTAKVPHNLFQDTEGSIWMATYDETSGETIIQKAEKEGEVLDILKTTGQYTKRPITQFGNHIYIGVFENELWQFSLDGTVIKKLYLPVRNGDLKASRLIQFQTLHDKLWILLTNGSVFSMENDLSFSPHRANALLAKDQNFSCFLLMDDLSLWLGGRGIFLYNYGKHDIIDYDSNIRELTKNTSQYRQIFKDRSGTIWIASDFGLIKLVQLDNLFTHYLSGGSEYCSDLYCSTRGMTEDDKGNIYISYYNSIHQLNPETGGLIPLFPSGDFFNYPFGLHFHDNALWTGNGLRIDLPTLKVDTILPKIGGEAGDVITDKNGLLWIGNQYQLFTYDTTQNTLTEYEDSLGKWDSINGQVSYLYQGSDAIWVGTLSNGLTKLDIQNGTRKTFSKKQGQLANDRINGVYEDENGYVWVATGLGLHQITPDGDHIKNFTTKEGLPNDFINGLLPEGDSVIWVSTDLGICRINHQNNKANNFLLADGLSANEFNRISFYKSKEGRMYFGGLNGVNAFFPGPEFILKKKEKRETPLLLTSFTSFNGKTDSLRELKTGLNNLTEVTFNHQDKFFTIDFSLADYRNPGQNLYSYQLEGYDEGWSPPSSVRSVRYNNIPAGNYTFRIKGKVGREDWNKNEVAVKVKVLKAFYKAWWFRIVSALLISGLVLGFFRYRVYTLQRREKELEKQVKERTKDLEKEKQKSEELLLNILPAETAEELKKHGVAKAKRHEPVTVMFSDFEGFSRISERLEPEVLVALIDRCFRAFDEITEKHGLEKIKTVGDAYLCVGGIFTSDKNLAINMINAALEIQEFMKDLAAENEPLDKPFFRARIGVNTGPVVAGIVGFKKFAFDIWGDTVNVASRMETYGAVDRVNITDTTYQLVKEQFKCNYHGDFKEHDKVIKMYLVDGVIE
jgi:class 3 adenylate cyclase/ligand-binding sensor domain-containing protein